MSAVRQDTVVVCQGCRFGCILGVSIDEHGLPQVQGNSCDRGPDWVGNVLARGGRLDGLDAAAHAPEAPDATREDASAPEATMGYRAFRASHARARDRREGARDG